SAENNSHAGSRPTISLFAASATTAKFVAFLNQDCSNCTRRARRQHQTSQQTPGSFLHALIRPQSRKRTSRQQCVSPSLTQRIKSHVDSRQTAQRAIGINLRVL